MDTTFTSLYMHTFSGITPDAIFATVTALTVVILSGIAQWIYNRRKDNIYLNDLRSLFCQHLKVLIQLVNKRIQSFEELAKVTPRTTSHFVYSKIAIPSEFSNQLSQVDLFRAIRKGSRRNKPKRIEAYSNLVEALNFISSELSITESQFHYFVSNNREYSREYIDSANEIVGLHRQYLAEARQADKKTSDDPMLADLNNLISAWSQIPNKDDAEMIYSSLLMPVRTICVTYQVDPRCVTLLKFVSKADIAKINRDNVLTLFGRYFQDEVLQLRSRRETIKNALNLFTS